LFIETGGTLDIKGLIIVKQRDKLTYFSKESYDDQIVTEGHHIFEAVTATCSDTDKESNHMLEEEWLPLLVFNELNDPYIAFQGTARTNTLNYSMLSEVINLLYGLVVRVPRYRSRGPGFDSRCYQIF
jgi:hypothetical protein